MVEISGRGESAGCRSGDGRREVRNPYCQLEANKEKEIEFYTKNENTPLVIYICVESHSVYSSQTDRPCTIQIDLRIAVVGKVLAYSNHFFPPHPNLAIRISAFTNGSLHPTYPEVKDSCVVM